VWPLWRRPPSPKGDSVTRGRVHRLAALLIGLAAAAAIAVTAASAASGKASAHRTGTASITIAFDMPCSTCASRFEEQDKPDFIKSVHKLNPNIKVIANNAQGSDATQIAQIQDALANGAKVIVVSPLDLATGVAIVSKAARYHVPVIAYDGLLQGAKIAFYVSFDNLKVGALQGQYLLSHLASGATVAMINGDQTSTPGVQFKQGALSVLNAAFQSGRLKLG